MKSLLRNINEENSHQIILMLLVLVGAALAVLFWQKDTLSIYDASGHLAAVESMRDFWPLPFGWNSQELLGWPQGMFYPSLFHYLGATLSFVVGSSSAIRILISIALVSLPLTINEFSKSFIKDRNWSILTTVLLFSLLLFIPDYLGVGVRGIFRVGLLSSFFVMPFVFLFFAQIPKVITGKFLTASLLLAVLLLTHFVAGLIAGFFLVTSILGNYQLKKNLLLLPLLKIIVISTTLTSFFLLPFFFYRQYASITAPEISSYFVPNLVGFVIAVLLLVVSYRKKQQSLFVLALASCGLLFFISLDSVSTKLFGFHSLTHNFYLFRFQPFAYIFLLTLFISFVSTVLVLDKKFINIVLTSCIGLLIIGLVIKNPAQVQTAQVSLEVDKEVSGRFLESYRRLQTFPAYYELQTSLNRENPEANWANGLFAESSVNSSFVQSLIKSLHPDLYPEGEGVLLETKFIDPSRVRSALHLLGINWLINFEEERKNSVAIWTKGPKTNYYNLEEISQDSLFEITDLKLTPIKDDWNQQVEKWWFEKGPIQNLPYLTSGERLESDQSSENTQLEIVEENSQGTRFRLNIKSDKKVPVLAKLSYFPSWKASSGGKEIKIYRAAPNLMLFEAKGEVILEYQTPTVQRGGYFISSLTLIAFVGLALKRRKQV